MTRIVVQNNGIQEEALIRLHQEEQQQQQQQQQQTLEVGLPDDRRGSVSCHTPQSEASPQVMPVTCLANNRGNADMSLMSSYPQQSQPFPAHQHQSDSRMQPPLPLTQVYSEHMMAIPMPHHHMLPM